MIQLRSMSRIALVLVAGSLSVAAAASEAPPPPPGGRIGTLALGRYVCEMPGDAASRPVHQFEFRVVNASSYKAGGVRGSYLYTGDRVVMTGGKLKGLRLHRISEGFLREIAEDGSDGPMRCVRTSRR
ncbi:hypothetical protein [Novosphingobium mangrovi (ex Huang et al. 2023)]|uniref:Elongation factor P n=1 Tax=Novosphingobium mangrovi (ex Huang et al. 2023) TaxID=2976432 RepID=A0ABT2I5E7_9SPHN|nr:hypothetical protein [Novosphingobium mangrovi (ex Huang et al. 2023)]MCT2400040.1 hypothetical protein [Novosphingobium mangrovi (ex Huang et al. 2023)]